MSSPLHRHLLLSRNRCFMNLASGSEAGDVRQTPQGSFHVVRGRGRGGVYTRQVAHAPVRTDPGTLTLVHSHTPCIRAELRQNCRKASHRATHTRPHTLPGTRVTDQHAVAGAEHRLAGGSQGLLGRASSSCAEHIHTGTPTFRHPPHPEHAADIPVPVTHHSTFGTHAGIAPSAFSLSSFRNPEKPRVCFTAYKALVWIILFISSPQPPEVAFLLLPFVARAQGAGTFPGSRGLCVAQMGQDPSLSDSKHPASLHRLVTGPPGHP